jgi:hypothetical protein
LAGGGTIGLLAALQPIYLILGAQWMIVGEGGVAQAVKPSSIEVRTKQTSVPAIQVRN